MLAERDELGALGLVQLDELACLDMADADKANSLMAKGSFVFLRFFQFDSAISVQAVVVAYRTRVMGVEWHAGYRLAFCSCGTFGSILADQA
jgi:hypothetical protein